MPSGPFTPGQGGMSPGQVPTGGVRTMDFRDANNNGIDDRDEPSAGSMTPQPTMPPPAMGAADDLFGAPGAGSYDNLMSRSFQEYTSGQSPYAGAADFLMNRPVSVSYTHLTLPTIYSV